MAKPDQIASYGPLQIERYGRYIRYSNTATSEEHAKFLEHSEKICEETLQDLVSEVPILQNLIGKYDPVELMHHAAYMLLPLFMEYRSESEFGSEESCYLPLVEYLQYLIARTPHNLETKDISEEEWAEVWKQGLKVFQLTRTYILTRRTLTVPPTQIDELRFFLDSQRLGIRVHRYSFFMSDYIRTSLAPYEQWIKDIYGVGVEEVIKGLKEIDEYQKRGVLDRYKDFGDLQGVLTARLRDRGYIVDPGASPEEVERTRSAFESDEFRVLHDEVQEKARLTFTSAIFDITDITSLPKAVLSLLSAKPGESILTTLTGQDHDDLSPLSTSPLHYKPFLEVNNRFFTFYHSGFEDHIAEIIESDLFEKRPPQVPVMAKRRSDRLETDSKELLVSIIKPDFVFQNVYYPNPDEVGGLTELDILLGVDDILFLVEAKAGGLSAGATRGAPRDLEKNLSDLIIEGQHQSERAEKYIRSADEIAFFDQTGRNAIYKLKHSAFRRIFRVVVTKEQLGWVGADIARLSILDPNLSKSFPWHVSIDDLRVVVELFRDNEIRFVHFLEQRLQASSETALSQNDEIEHIGLYNKINHYHQLPVKGMNRVSFDASYMQDIDYYFMEKTAGESPEIPTQVMSPKMKGIIDALRDSRVPGRFEAGSIILSMDQTGRSEFQRGLDILDQGRTEGRQRTFRMPFTKSSLGLTVSYANGIYWQEEMKRSAVQMEQSCCERWLVIQLANKTSCETSHIEAIYPGRFSEAELASAKLHHEEVIKRKVADTKPGRNDKCPCGSGKKYKKCHGL